MLRDAGEALRKAADRQSLAILLAAKSQDVDKNGDLQEPKINFLAMVSDDLTGKLRAGDWVKQVAQIADGAGGGRPQMAMAGGKNVAAADEALAHGREMAARSLSGQ
jgi:alanyl-tRNA synthetase